MFIFLYISQYFLYVVVASGSVVAAVWCSRGLDYVINWRTVQHCDDKSFSCFVANPVGF